jgi:hypothetical protein
MSEPEYAIYLRQQRNDPVILRQIEEVNNEIREAFENSQNHKVPNYLLNKKRELNNSLEYWHECVHADNINTLFRRAMKYFNDWYCPY